MNGDDTLTRAERADLQRVARMRAKVARDGIDALKAQRKPARLRAIGWDAG